MALVYRRAGPEDAAVLAALRLEFMRIVKDGGIPDEEAWLSFLAGYFARGLARGSLLAWLCLDGGEVVATAALRVDAIRQGRKGEGAKEGYVMSIFTLPAWRRRGLALRLMALLLAEAEALGLRRLLLHPTEDGRALYESLGFRPYRTIMILPLPATLRPGETRQERNSP